MNTVFVPAARVERWVANFGTGHGGATLTVEDGALTGRAADRSWFAARLPFSTPYDGVPTAAAFAAAIAVPEDSGVLLVRKGGFAIARVAGGVLVESKVGQRHVQGRTKAGGWSQQRYARRRANQADEAFAAAAGHADRILAGLIGPLVVGGEASAVAAARELLADRRLRELTPSGEFLTVPDPRREVLERAVRDAASAVVRVVNA